jgi:Protein of unknown function (DUF3644)
MVRKRTRTIFSVKNELLEKSKESALCAVQIFNNPNITFKSEAFIVLMIIAWTYLLHAYYRNERTEYRYFNQKNKKRIFDRTSKGSFKYWELERCLNDSACPLENNVKSNLKFLIGLRHEIEHQMTNRIDDFISGKLQACCLNYNAAIKKLFNHSIAHHQPISIQFFAFSEEQIDTLIDKPNIPKNVIEFITSHEASLSAEDKQSPQYSYKVIYMRDNANHEGQADKAIRFIPEGTEEGREIHNVLVKNKQYSKLTQTDIVSKMHVAGYLNFSKNDHQLFWKSKWPTATDRNNNAKKYGELVVKDQWLWYSELWLPLVEEYCKKRYANNP